MGSFVCSCAALFLPGCWSDKCLRRPHISRWLIARAVETQATKFWRLRTAVFLLVAFSSASINPGEISWDLSNTLNSLETSLKYCDLSSDQNKAPMRVPEVFADLRASMTLSRRVFPPTRACVTAAFDACGKCSAMALSA